MPETPRYVSRIARLPLVDADGSTIGKVDDVVFTPASGSAPRVLGFIASMQRRRIFVNANRIAALDPDGVRMRSGTIDLRPFRKREGELLAMADLVGKRVGDEFVIDLSIVKSDGHHVGWALATLALGGRGPLSRRRSPTVVSWEKGAQLFDMGAEAAEVARLREMRPADVATQVRRMPLAKRQEVARRMEDDDLADLLEELPEDEQVRLIEGLDLERVAGVLEEMDPDDAADLLGEMDAEERARVLEAMEEADATPLRRLLTYDTETAGGLMTPEPVIMTPTATVAEALATLRNHDLPVALAAQVFVVKPPMSVPTGTFLGRVGFQRLLREPPSTFLKDCLPDEPLFLDPATPTLDVASRLAAYDMVAIAVCDGSRRLVGAVTIDDVLDHMLPDNWRRRLKRTAGP